MAERIENRHLGLFYEKPWKSSLSYLRRISTFIDLPHKILQLHHKILSISAILPHPCPKVN